MEGWDGFEEDDWSEALRDGSVFHAFMFEEPTAAQLAVEEDREENGEGLPGAPFGDWIQV